MASTSGRLDMYTPKLLISAIEEKAKWTPNDTYMRYPGADWEIRGYDTISWSQYARSVDKVAYWLDNSLGPAGKNDTIAYFGPNDSRYAIIVPAATKSGRKLLVPDGRVTTEGLKGLVQSTGCKAWMYAEDDPNGPLIDRESELRTLALPSLDWMLGNEGQVRYPYEKTFAEAVHDVIAIIHTSGTTGIPKAIQHTNGMWSAMGSTIELSQRCWPRGITHESWIGRTALNCCAPQWLAGMHGMIIAPVYMNSPCIMLPADVASPSPDLFKKLVQMNAIDGIKCPPHTVVSLYEDPQTRELLKSLKFITFMGAALSRSIGDDLCQYTRLTTLIGSTETGDQQSLRPLNRELWYTHDFLLEKGGKMIPVDSTNDGRSDLYELVLERPIDGSDNVYQPAFWNPAFKDMTRIETKELYAPIDDLDGRKRWIFTTRKDDLTKLNWLAKFHAHDIEVRIQQHPDVKSVCVGGEGRPAPYVIVEMQEGVLDRETEEQLLESLYATVISNTNAADINEIHIPKELVVVAKTNRPLKRNLKQVVMRKEVEKDYQEEIEQAYSQLKASAVSSR